MSAESTPPQCEAARQALGAEGEADMVLVPREPTAAMMEAGYEGWSKGTLKHAYQAMLQAVSRP